MKDKKDFWVSLSLSWLVVFVLWLGAPFLVNLGLMATNGFGLPVKFDEGVSTGSFGDQYGAINALFSGLALAAIAISLWYQREDIANQRKDLGLQQQAILDQKGIMDKQLRFTATTEIVASLPVVQFSKYKTMTPGRPISIRIDGLIVRNTGTEVYDAKIFMEMEDGDRFQVGKTESVWDAKTELSIPDESLELLMTLQFIIRSGEQVEIEYLKGEPGEEPYKLSKSWYWIIKDLLNRRMESLENRTDED